MKDHVVSFFSLLGAFSMTHVSNLSKKISTGYASNGDENGNQEGSIQILYKDFKNEPSKLPKI
jgi:hypothetical protein